MKFKETEIRKKQNNKRENDLLVKDIFHTFL